MVLTILLWISNSRSTLANAHAASPNGLGSVSTMLADQAPVTIQGELRKWHKITLRIDGPFAQENGNPNPFTDYRLDVTFRQGGKTYKVPGYFAADGNAAETSATEGSMWLVHFRPDATGDWSYSISFRKGSNVATASGATAGSAVSGIDGLSGTFRVSNSNKSGRDNRAKGRLSYIGKRYLQYEESGEYFLKGGPDAPENFLSYEDFDNTPNNKGYLKSWAPHQRDWNNGDPSWKGGKGTEIIGAINYLASKGLNAFSFLTMSYRGDDRSVYPWVNPDASFLRYDVSKLAQWEIVFEHADQMGMYLHFKMQETENDELLDGGNLGNERKLYIRELIARFGHHLALNWNVGEENNQTTSQRKAMAQHIADVDPYDHHIVVHSYPRDVDVIYPPLLGNASALTGMSLQHNYNRVHEYTEKYIRLSEEAGRPWVIANDEQGPSTAGVPPDEDWPGRIESTPTIEQVREQCLWGNLMAGGGGVEYYFGYAQPESDVTLNDYRSRDDSWTYVNHALTFFRNFVPYYDMDSRDDLVSDGYCLAKTGEVYLVYLLSGGEATLKLSNDAQYQVRWYNPRKGGALQTGSVDIIRGPGSVSIGRPPNDQSQDWAILVERQDLNGNRPPDAAIITSSNGGPAPQPISFDASQSADPDGKIMEYEWNFGDGTSADGMQVEHTYTKIGDYEVSLKVMDDKGAIGLETQPIIITGNNELPIPDFSIAAAKANRSFQFNGNLSRDPDGKITAYIWDFGDGKTDKGNPKTHTYANDGTYTVTLTVRDDNQATVSISKDVVVGNTTAPNQAPNASFSASPNQGTAPVQVVVDAGASTDSDGTIQLYQWNFGDGTTAEGVTANHTYTTAGSYTITLKVTDEDGATDQANRTVTVTPTDQNPSNGSDQLTAVITADKTSGDAPLTIQFSGRESIDPDGRVVAFRWEFGDGGTASGPNQSHTFTQEGTYTLSLTIRGSDLETATATQVIVVGGGSEPNTPPVARFTKNVTEGTAPLAIQFDASGSSDSDGSIVRYDWNFSNGATATGQKPSYTFQNPGTYTITLQVTDDQGATDQISQSITVKAPDNGSTKLVADFTMSPETGEAPLEVTFDGRLSDAPNGRIVAYRWSFGDGNRDSGQPKSHTYTEAGTYTVQLEIQDNNGNRATKTKQLTVLPSNNPSNQAPVAQFTYNPNGGTAPQTITFDGTASYDPDGQLITYFWDFGDGNSASGSTVNHEYTTAGTYSIQLTVTDDAGQQQTITKNLTIEAPVGGKQLPEPDFRMTFSNASKTAPLTVYFDGRPSVDPDGRIVAYIWDFGDGTTTKGNPKSHTYNAPGTYTIKLTVRDNDLQTASTTKTLTVVDPNGGNQAPVAIIEATPMVGTAPLTVDLDGRSSYDPEGATLQYQWVLGLNKTANTASTQLTYEQAGTYEVLLTVTDPEGATDTKSVQIIVNPEDVNVPPTAAFTANPTRGTAPLSVQFDASGSRDSDGWVESYSWNFSDGNNGTGIRPTNTFTEAGSYLVRVTVTDNEGGVATATKTIIVDPPSTTTNNPPVASFTLRPEQGAGPLDVDVDGSGSTDSDGSIVRYVWDFGDGSTKTGNPKTHRYTQSGTFQIVLTVTDNEGATASAQKTVTVTDGASDCEKIFVEQDGLLVVEMESVDRLPDGWKVANSKFDPTGSGYIYWSGKQSTKEPSGNIIAYTIEINNPGTYRFDWRVAVGTGNSTSEHNDTWLRINADYFYGERFDGSSRVRPRPYCETDAMVNCPRGSSGDGFFKIYGGLLDQFQWKSFTNDGAGHYIYARFDKAGIYEIEIDARSSNHLIDRMVMYRQDLTSRTEATKLDKRELTKACTQTTSSLPAPPMDEEDTVQPNDPGDLFGFRQNSNGSTTFRVAASVGEMERSFQLYPNPATTQVQVEIPAVENAHLRILDASGRVLFHRQQPTLQSRIDLSGLRPGVYLVQLQTNDQLLTKRLVIQ